MYYEINVSKEVEDRNGHKSSQHFFATAKRSIVSTFQLKQVLPVILAKFPESEGYDVSVTRQEEIGYGLSIEEALKA